MTSQFSLLRLELPFTVLNGIFIVQLPTCLNLSEAIALQATCQNLLRKKPTQIILDSRQCTTIESSGIGAIINIVKLAKELGIELFIQSMHPQIKAALLLAGIDSLVIVESENKTIPPLDSHHLKYQIQTHPSVCSRIKRFIDIIGALIGLGIIVILFIPIAIAIKLDSPGPILFSQTRCGWLGRHFRLWKFRSMVSNAESLKAKIENQVEGPFFKNRNDSRITRVGRFLRRTSLDELPQFWNVIKGEMSLVGTRPPTTDEVVQYTLPMWQRLDVKPGITGEWQTNGRSKISNFQDVVYLDLHYQKKWSVMYDLKLIFKTLLIVFRKRSGAS